jgi:hypothetical protein
MEFIDLKVLIIGMIETRELILKHLDFFRSGTAARRIIAQRFHHGNNKMSVDDWERNFSVVVIEEVQFDELERMNNDFVSRNNNIIDFRNDMRITGNGF